ncbi:multidrug effflux MFS transporter [Mesorhizobium sp. CGMCC 1.15528]|uniref:Bcr/CflA family efflux transporter n=1 Tax=Mesorhizobium zhangyense TaxID=1776730 RepID=A0A7C9RAC7_9HYPH|nr:multidrug effflux MFS transporter [Mesorhizobium zhangyense]NGN42073.1 multidrug effflux MFS transporter [Mesorhizobium zhangyense]
MNMQPPLASAPVMSERRTALIGALMVAIGPVSMALFTPAMPGIVHAFGTTEAAVKMTMSLYFGGFAFAQLVCGPLSDAFGRRPVTIAFMAIYLAGSIFALLSPTIELLITARFLQGIGAAVGVAVSRALVRDLFTHERSARIMNLIGIILAIGPAFAPTLGGFTMELFGWHAIFLLMVTMGIAIVLVTIFAMRETVMRDTSLLRPVQIVRSYGSLFKNPYFMLSSLTIAGTSGALYAQATMLPFIMMERVGLTPTEFGVGMLIQSLSYLFGSLVLRAFLGRFGAFRMVPIGLVFVGVASLATALILRLMEPSFMDVMGPVGLYAFGIAFVTPAMSTAAMAPFPQNAGAASAMMGFLQMGFGLLGGTCAALIGDPAIAMATIVPVMGLTAILSWTFWQRLPEPALLAKHRH